jgi:hypothetical protein
MFKEKVMKLMDLSRRSIKSIGNVSRLAVHMKGLIESLTGLLGGLFPGTPVPVPVRPPRRPGR